LQADARSAIVDDEGDAVRPAQCRERLRVGQLIAFVAGLVAPLHDGSSTSNRLLGHVDRRPSRAGGRIDDHVEPVDASFVGSRHRAA
jgi:hypothetical protein